MGQLKLPYFVSNGVKPWPRGTVFVSDWLMHKNILPYNHLAKWNKSLQEETLGGSWLSFFVSSGPDKPLPPWTILVSVLQIPNKIFSWNWSAKWINILEEDPMQGLSLTFPISSWLDKKYGNHFFFLIMIYYTWIYHLLWNCLV